MSTPFKNCAIIFFFNCFKKCFLLSLENTQMEPKDNARLVFKGRYRQTIPS